MRRPILIINCAAVVILTVILGLSGCGKRDIPGGLVNLYNSEMQKTAKFSPLETMYVGLNGLAADKLYKVEALDPDGQTITELTAMTNSQGSLAPTPLWFDVGLHKADATHATPWIDPTDKLELRSFYVRVSSSDGLTDYKQPFFMLYKNDPLDNTEKPKTIAYASDSKGNLANTFEEAGSQTYNDLTHTVTPSDKTKVYVTIDRLDPAVTNVDVYVLPFNPTSLYKNGDPVPNTANSIKKSLTLATDFNQTGTALTSKLPVWDITNQSAPATGGLLTNPDDTNAAYTVVVMTNPVRTTLKLSNMVNGINKSVTDAIDGNGVAGFIVMNTPANDLKYSISDNLGNKTGVLTEGTSGGLYNSIDANRYLVLNLDNVSFPATPDGQARVYVVPANPLGTPPATIPADVRGGFTSARVAPPAMGDLHLLPYISNATLLATSNLAVGLAPYQYAADVPADTDFDVIVKFDGAATFTMGSDIYIPKAVRVNDFVVNNSLKTFSATALTAETNNFDETGTLGGKTKVYVNFATTLLPYPTTSYNVYLYKAGTKVPNATLNDGSARMAKSLKFNTAVNHTALFWDLNADIVKLINPVAANNTYDIIVDLNNNNKYDAGEKLTVVINDTPANAFPRVTYANIASSGFFTGGDGHWTATDFGYLDNFDRSGTGVNGTNYGFGTWYPGLDSYPGYGIKAIWNPYIGFYNGPKPDLNLSGYVGNAVDVYVVDAATFKLKNWQNRKLTDLDDVTGHHKTLPVQEGCTNGAWENNIWPAPMKPGKYYVIVDLNRDGYITEGVDIIDAVNRQGKTILEDPDIVGFTVN